MIVACVVWLCSISMSLLCSILKFPSVSHPWPKKMIYSPVSSNMACWKMNHRNRRFFLASFRNLHSVRGFSSQPCLMKPEGIPIVAYHIGSMSQRIIKPIHPIHQRILWFLAQIAEMFNQFCFIITINQKFQPLLSGNWTQQPSWGPQISVASVRVNSRGLAQSQHGDEENRRSRWDRCWWLLRTPGETHEFVRWNTYVVRYSAIMGHYIYIYIWYDIYIYMYRMMIIGHVFYNYQWTFQEHKLF